MKKLIVLTFSVALLASAAVASASYVNNPLPPNHHIHDCTAAPCVYPHLAVGFFPRILRQSLGTFLEDPAVCNDATDKALLPGDAKPEGNQPLRAGVCSTSTTIIHMRSIDVGDPAPEGWSGPIAPTVLKGVTYVTYWLLTPR
jgi:hypothetical protein